MTGVQTCALPISGVQIPPAPPIQTAKTLSLHFDQPLQATCLAGFFTSACGLRHPPLRPFLALHPRFSSLFLCPLRTRKRPSRSHQTMSCIRKSATQLSRADFHSELESWVDIVMSLDKRRLALLSLAIDKQHAGVQ